MHCSGVMENGNLRRYLAAFNQVVAFEAALVAETHGADVTAAITFNTFNKLIHPVAEFISENQSINL